MIHKLTKTVTTLTIGILCQPIGLVILQNAEARPSTKQFTCPALKQVINQRGALVLDTKNNQIYKRFVKNRSFCELVQSTAYFTVPSKSGSCRIKICKDINPGGGG